MLNDKQSLGPMPHTAMSVCSLEVSSNPFGDSEPIRIQADLFKQGVSSKTKGKFSGTHKVRRIFKLNARSSFWQLFGSAHGEMTFKLEMR